MNNLNNTLNVIDNIGEVVEGTSQETVPENIAKDESIKETYNTIGTINANQNKIFTYFKNLFNGNNKKYDELFKKKVIILFNDLLRDLVALSVSKDRKVLYRLYYRDKANTIQPFFDDNNQFMDVETQKSSFSFSKFRRENATFENAFLNILQYNKIVITEYSSKAETLQKLDINDMQTYMDEFNKHLVHNNYGRDTLKIDNFDNSLLIKRFEISEFFRNFNKSNAYEYKGLQSAIERDKELYIKNVEIYNELLVTFLEDIDTFINNNELNALVGMGIWHILSNYWGLFLIVLLVMVLIFMYITMLFHFFNTKYKKYISKQVLNWYESQFYGFDQIYNIGGFYIDFPNLVFLVIYIIFFLLFIPINLIYIAEVMKAGNLRIFGCSGVFNKNVDVGIYPLMVIYMILVVFNILYYVYILYSSSSYKDIRENDDLITLTTGEYQIKELLDYLNSDDEVHHHMFEKMNNWAYGGTKERNDERAGNTSNIDDMVNKRLKMLITGIIAIYYINSRNREDILENNSTGTKSIFLYATKDKPIFPTYAEIKNTNLFKSIINPLPQFKYQKCEADDKSYFCQNKTNFENNIYKMPPSAVATLREKYNNLCKIIQTSADNIKKHDNLFMYKVGIIISTFFLVFYLLAVVQVISWFGFKRSIFRMLYKKKKLAFNIFTSYLLLVVVL